MCKKWYEGVVNFGEYVDDRGSLFPIDFNELPFVPQRTFVIRDVPNNTTRGEHAHKICEQVVVCLNDIIDIVLFDGAVYITYTLCGTQALYIPAMCWGKQQFINNATSLVFASTPYDEDEYIRNFEEFMRLI